MQTKLKNAIVNILNTMHTLTKMLNYFKNKRKEKEIKNAEEILLSINKNRGLLWENIKVFIDRLKAHENGVVRGTKAGDELFPLKHHFAGGLYTREIFMPKGTIIASLIHKTDWSINKFIKLIYLFYLSK